MNDIKTLILGFANRLQAIIEAEVIDRARTSALAAMGIPAPPKVGRPPKALVAKVVAANPVVVVKARRKGPLQLCPVPGCKNAAAPVFGMVCAKHKDLPKATIKKFREARKAKKLKAAGKAPAKTGAAKAKRKPSKAVRTSPAKKAKARRPKEAKATPPSSTAGATAPSLASQAA